MANEFLSSQHLDDETPESAFSGTKDLPEVRDIQGWLTGKYNTGNDFRDQALSDVIAQRTELPEWGKGLGEEKTLPEAIAEKVFSDGDGDGMNKVGEFFYSVKDGFASAIESIPTALMDVGGSLVKSIDPDNKTATKVLDLSRDIRKNEQFDKELRDFRLGVESDALSNEFGNMLGLMGSLILGGAAAGGGKVGAAVAAAGEGLMEGGQFAATTIDEYAERAGGLEEYAGEGSAAAAAHGTVAGLIGLLGVEARFLNKFGKFANNDFVKGVAGEALEEGLQYVSERGFRRADNAVRGDNVDEMTWQDELKNAGRNMLMGSLGGATIGGIAVANNRIRAREILQDNLGLSRVDADKAVNEYMGDIAREMTRNTAALKEIESPDSPVVQEIKTAVQEVVPVEENADTTQQDKILHRAQDIVVMQQQAQDAPMADSPVFSQDESVRKPAIESVVEQARTEVAVLDNAETRARDELAALEAQEVSPLRAEQHAEEIAQKQAEIDTIREMAGQEPEFNVGQIVDSGAITELKNQLNSDIIQAIEENSPDPDLSVGAELSKYDDRYDTGKERVSNFTARISKETGQEATKYRMRDTKAADTAADTLVRDDEVRAVRFLRDRSLAQLDGLSKPEILEALYRKHRGNAEELAKLSLDFSHIATQAGRDVQAFSEKEVWNADARIRDINNQIAREAPKVKKNQMADEKAKLKEAIKIKKERLPSDAEIERMTRELLGCK